MAQYEHELPVYKSASDIQEAVGEISECPDMPIITQLEGGYQAFADSVFEGLEQDKIYAKNVTRPVDGIGAHFDIYGQFIDQEYPFVATYNKRGSATLRATVLDQELQSYYDNRYPEPSSVARQARRSLSALAFTQPGALIYTGNIEPGTGLVIPQVSDKLHVVHKITPVRPFRKPLVPGSTSDGGAYVKFSVPKDSKEAHEDLIREGYIGFDEYLERETREKQIREDAANREAKRIEAFEQEQKEIQEEDDRIWAQRNHRRVRRPGGTLFD